MQVIRDQKNREELASYLRLLRSSAVVNADKEYIDSIKNKAKFLLAEDGGVEALKKEIAEVLELELDSQPDKAQQEKEKKLGITAAGLFIGVSLLLIASDSLAAFDLAVAGRAVFDPVITLVTEHFGKGVVAVGGVGAPCYTWC